MNRVFKSTAYIYVLLGITLSFFPLWGNAQPFLWEAKEPESGKVVYLFGTIHSGNPAVNQLHPLVIDKFQRARSFFAELDLSPEGVQELQASILQAPSVDIKTTLGKNRVKRVNSVLRQINPGLSIDLFTELPLWAFVTNLSIIEEQVRYPNQPAMDQALFSQAINAGKYTAGLETIDEQLSVFTSLTNNELLEILDATLQTMEADYAANKNPMAPIYDAYIKGDNSAFQEIMDEQLPVDPALNKKINQRLITHRNQVMTERIQQAVRATKTPLFVAIGAGHFAPDSGIQALLENKGWSIKRLGESN